MLIPKISNYQEATCHYEYIKPENWVLGVDELYLSELFWDPLRQFPKLKGWKKIERDSIDPSSTIIPISELYDQAFDFFYWWQRHFSPTIEILSKYSANRHMPLFDTFPPYEFNDDIIDLFHLLPYIDNLNIVSIRIEEPTEKFLIVKNNSEFLADVLQSFHQESVNGKIINISNKSLKDQQASYSERIDSAARALDIDRKYIIMVSPVLSYEGRKILKALIIDKSLHSESTDILKLKMFGSCLNALQLAFYVEENREVSQIDLGKMRRTWIMEELKTCSKHLEENSPNVRCYHILKDWLIKLLNNKHFILYSFKEKMFLGIKPPCIQLSQRLKINDLFNGLIKEEYISKAISSEEFKRIFTTDNLIEYSKTHPASKIEWKKSKVEFRYFIESLGSKGASLENWKNGVDESQIFLWKGKPINFKKSNTSKVIPDEKQKDIDLLINVL